MNKRFSRINRCSFKLNCNILDMHKKDYTLNKKMQLMFGGL